MAKSTVELLSNGTTEINTHVQYLYQENKQNIVFWSNDDELFKLVRDAIKLAIDATNYRRRPNEITKII